MKISSGVFFAGVVVLIFVFLQRCSRDPSRNDIINQYLKNGTVRVEKLMFEEEYEAQDFCNDVKWEILNKGSYRLNTGEKVLKAELDRDKVIIYIVQ